MISLEILRKDELYYLFSVCSHTEVLSIRALNKHFRKITNSYYVSHMDWNRIVWRRLPEYFIREFAAHLDLYAVIARTAIYQNRYFSREFLRDFSEYVFWSGLCSMELSVKKYAPLESFLDEFCDRLNWSGISQHQKLSEHLIIKYQDKLDWQLISYYQTLSENFIRQNKHRWTVSGWTNISIRQELSEDFIREFKDQLNWFFISAIQKMSECFILENKDRVVWRHIFKHQKVSSKTMEKYKVA